jgi:hypothetical protein
MKVRNFLTFAALYVALVVIFREPMMRFLTQVLLALGAPS